MSGARERAELVLEDGTRYPGQRFGAVAEVTGEVVFNTAIAGYVESLSDPSYRGQILVLTYPLIGSYGVPAERPAAGIDPPFESARIQVQGLVVQNYVERYSHHRAARSLGQWLAEAGVPGLSGIDTRALTRRLREKGTMGGWLLAPGSAPETCAGVEMREEVFRLVAPPEPMRYPGGALEVMVIDVGAKDNIVRSLLERGAAVTRVPWHAGLAAHARRAHGIVIGNGPGDPRDLAALSAELGEILGWYPGAVLGICLGNQILARAVGAETYKLPYGHRGINQPVQDLLTRRCHVTSQNHGYAVRDESLPAGWDPWFVNINDGTNEGIRCRNRAFMSVQFHPEARPGPTDTAFLFDEFMSLAGSLARG